MVGPSQGAAFAQAGEGFTLAVCEVVRVLQQGPAGTLALLGGALVRCAPHDLGRRVVTDQSQVRVVLAPGDLLDPDAHHTGEPVRDVRADRLAPFPDRASRDPRERRHRRRVRPRHQTHDEVLEVRREPRDLDPLAMMPWAAQFDRCRRTRSSHTRPPSSRHLRAESAPAGRTAPASQTSTPDEPAPAAAPTRRSRPGDRVGHTRIGAGDPGPDTSRT